LSEKKLKKIKDKNIKLKQVREYIPFSERIESENDEQKSILNKNKDDSSALSEMISETRKEVMEYPNTNKNLILLESTFEHDLVFKDLINGIIVNQKHIDNNASKQGFEFLNNSVKALALNESEKRYSIKNLLGKNR
jgi:hypothetical protein